jgi:hypothetical protein
VEVEADRMASGARALPAANRQLEQAETRGSERTV